MVVGVVVVVAVVDLVWDGEMAQTGIAGMGTTAAEGIMVVAAMAAVVEEMAVAAVAVVVAAVAVEEAVAAGIKKGSVPFPFLPFQWGEATF